MIISNAISPYKEMVAYETLWTIDPKGTFKSIHDSYFSHENKLPSTVLEKYRTEELFSSYDTTISKVRDFIDPFVGKFNVSVNGDPQYSQKLRVARNPLELFYYKGDINLLDTPGISVVGARKVTPDGELRTKKVINILVDHGYTVISGLAEGVDTAAHRHAIQRGGKTVGVIGTPINEYYPKKNVALQDKISRDYLLISQVPFYRYHKQDFRINRFFFPQRNETMAALSEATIIVEASDTSGSLTQARECVRQGKKLFILDSCFRDDLKWPWSYAKKPGVIRVKSIEDIILNLKK